jgi:hypothetical protein
MAHPLAGGAECFALNGSFIRDGGAFQQWSWLRLLPGPTLRRLRVKQVADCG